MSIDIDGNERRVLYEFARDAVVRHRASRVLDLACGDGEGTAIIAGALPGAEVLGVDLSPQLIAEARAAHGDATHLRFEEGDALHLSYPDGSFDAIVSCHTIEHFNEPDQRRFLAELRRVLRSDGVLVVATPDRDVWAMLGIAGQQEDHIRELTQAEFVGLTRAAGFTVDEVFGQSILREGSFLFRRLLNMLKHLDVLRVRRLLGVSVRTIDKKTQPIVRDATVFLLASGAKASTTVLVARPLTT